MTPVECLEEAARMQVLAQDVYSACRFAPIHAEYLAQVFAPGMQSLFSALARQDRIHVELLRQALNAREG